MLRKVSLTVFTVAILASPSLIGQGQTPAPSTGGGTTTPAPSVPGGTSAPPVGRTPGIPSTTGNTNPNNTSPFPAEMARPIYVSGRVMMEDGTPPPESLVIERVCNGQPRPEGYTDSKGRFNFELGRNGAMMMDASTSNGRFDSQGGGSSSARMPGESAVTERSLMGCEIRASLAGYRSQVVSLAGRRMLDSPDIGTILLKRMANVEGFTYSATTGMAPKEAKKAYDKGLDLAKKKKNAEAFKEFEKATTAYPKFSAAWYELGQIQQAQNNMEDARKSFELYIASDPKFVKPYLPLLGMAVQKGNWEEVAEVSAKTVKLNPYEYPQAFYYNALANLNLKKYDEAEKSALSAQKLDERGRIPRIRYVLGIAQAQKSDFKSATENLKAYLTSSPGATDIETVKRQLGELEKLMGEQQETAAAAINPKP